MSLAAPRRTLFKGATILTLDSALGDLAKGDLLVEGQLIAGVAPSLDATDSEVIDASDTILIPGFVDAHRHAWQGSLRRLMPNTDSLDAYVQATHYTLGQHYRPEDHYVGNLLTALGCIDAGTTTMIDASHNARSPEHTDACIDAINDAGLRALHMPGKPLAGDWTEHWPHDLERLKAERFASDDQLVTLGMFCIPDPALWSFARQIGIRMLTEFLGPMAGMLEGLRDHLGPDNIFNHCTSLPEEAWQLLAETGVSITVDPRSDAQYALAGGVFAWQQAVDHGIRPGIGTDLETAYGGDMPTELRVAFSLQRAVAQSRRHDGDDNAPTPVKVQELLRAATIDGARCAGLDHKIGSLTPGKQADLVMVRTDGIGIFPSNHAVGTIVHAVDRSHTDTVMIAGKFRKRGGQLVNIDMASIRRRAEASIEHLFSAVGRHPDIFAETFETLPGDRLSAWTGG
ncbi:MAG: amidohydrolase family protein [Aliidongia sp.]